MIDSLLVKLANIAETEFADVTTCSEIKEGKYGRMSRHSHIIFIIGLMIMYLKVSCHESQKRH